MLLEREGSLEALREYADEASAGAGRLVLRAVLAKVGVHSRGAAAREAGRLRLAVPA